MKGKIWKTPFGWHINHLGKNKSSQILKKTSFKAHPAHGNMFSCKNVHPVHQLHRFFPLQTPSNSLILTTTPPSGKNSPPPTAVKSVQEIFSWGQDSRWGFAHRIWVPESCTLQHVPCWEEDGRKIIFKKCPPQKGYVSSLEVCS